MKFPSSLMRTMILSGMIFWLLGCTAIGNKTIDMMPVQPGVPEIPESGRSDIKIKVYNFSDARQGLLDPHLIGKRTSLGLSIGDVYSETPVFKTVTESVKSAFRSKGYSIVNEKEDFSIKGKINQFWAKTPVKMMLYWDVVGEINLTMELSRPGQKVITTLGPYNGRKVESTAINPSPQIIRNVLTGALMDTIQEMSSDPNLINVLTNKQKNN
jgi:uncharacterized lipoprotein YajG